MAADYRFRAAGNIHEDETEVEFGFTALQDTDEDHGESVRLGFGTPLPAGVTLASTNRTATVTIIDDDPAVTVSIEQASYEVVEGESLSVAIMLSEEPHRPVAIPVTFTDQGGADLADHNLNAGYIIDIPATHFSGSVTFDVTQDTRVERGEGVKVAIGSDLTPGVSTGTNDELTVNFIDDDPAVTVSFGAATYSADEGDSVDVTLTLSVAPQRSVTIPIAAAGEGGGTSADFSVPDSVTFASGDTSKRVCEKFRSGWC